MITGRVMATHVGVAPGAPNSVARICFRCGVERQINGRQDRSKPFLCGDCKAVDPALARRLGLKTRKPPPRKATPTAEIGNPQ